MSSKYQSEYTFEMNGHTFSSRNFFISDDPKKIWDYHAYKSNPVDLQYFVVNAAYTLQGLPNADDILSALRAKFKSAGWEGDGEIGLIWLPPFVHSDSDNMGDHIWYVKQDNNGTCFYLSPTLYRFPGLELIV